MLKQFKKISVKKAILALIVCWALAALAFVIGGGQHIFKALGRPTLLDVENIGLFEGEYVTATIDYSLGRFAYTTEDDKIISHEFAVVDFEAGYIYSLFISKNEYNKLADWLPSDYDGEVEPRTVAGTLVKMTADDQEYFDELLEAIEAPFGWKAPYYLKVGYVGETTTTAQAAIFAGGGLFLFGLGLFFFIRAITGQYQKSIVQYCRQSGSPEYTMDLLEGQLSVAEQFKNTLWAMPHFFILQNGRTTQLLPANSVVWCFQRVTRTNGIVSSRALVLATDGKKHHTVTLSEKEMTRCLDFIFERYPHIAIGYNDHLNSLWSRSPAELVAFAAQQHQQAPAAPQTMPPITAHPMAPPQVMPQPVQQESSTSEPPQQ